MCYNFGADRTSKNKKRTHSPNGAIIRSQVAAAVFSALFRALSTLLASFATRRTILASILRALASLLAASALLHAIASISANALRTSSMLQLMAVSWSRKKKSKRKSLLDSK